jgi:hypothetical protein
VFGIQCADSIAQSVEIDDQLNVYWRQRAESSADDPTLGEFFLRSVLVFSGKNDLNAVFRKEYDGVDLKDTRVFDYYPYNGGPIYALLPAVGERIEDRVLIFNERQVSPTALDYMAYMKELRLTRGFLYWQYLFSDRLDVEEYELRAIQRGLAFVEREFPHDDYVDLRARLKHLESRS